MKNSKKTCFETVLEQINDIHNRIHNFEKFDSLHSPTINDNKVFKSIGDPMFLDYENFEYEAQQILNGENYYILFKDGCVANLAYLFDSNGKILSHNLYFVSLFEPKLYLRFDYFLSDPNEEAKHYSSHLHTSMLRECLRIPVDMPLSPYHFLHIILKHFYNDESGFTKSLVDSRWESFNKATAFDFPYLKIV